MPLTIPTLDDRSYQDLLDEALSRIPVHNPEWTNFNESDPGVTLLEIFAFLTDNLLYRANQIPERNRLKFLTLLGVPLQPAASAQGIAVISNDQGPARTFSLNGGLEMRAGQVPFRTERGLDVLPIQASVYYKQPLLDPDPTLVDYYNQLYASYQQPPASVTFSLYQVSTLTPSPLTPVDVSADTIDGALWIALLARTADELPAIKREIAGRTLTLGVLPGVSAAGRRLGIDSDVGSQGSSTVDYLMPKLDSGSALPPVATYRTLVAVPTTDVLFEPGVVEITLPSEAELGVWQNLQPLEAGVGDFPPALDDSTVNDRLITWIKLKPRAPASGILLWVGINAVPILQRAHVDSEVLPNATGEPDQVVTLANTPLLPDSTQLTVIVNGAPQVWERIDDLMSADPEVPVADPRLPPGTPPPSQLHVNVYVEDPEAGTLQFGDGTRGRRPPAGALIRATYDYSLGAAGNLGATAINSAPALPAGLRATNPIPTWGGAEAETAADGEKQITRFLQHRDRLVTMADFEAVTWRTPGVAIGRVDVLPAFHPVLSPNEPGDAPGVVTVMVLPLREVVDPAAQQLFLTAVSDYLAPRRLVTTEIFLRGPTYVDIWVSIGIDVVAGQSPHDVIMAVRSAVQAFLSPLPQVSVDPLPKDVPLVGMPSPDGLGAGGGWPLRKPVVALEIAAVVSRVPGVMLVNLVILAAGADPSGPQVPMVALQLPRLVGVSIVEGDPVALDDIRGSTAPSAVGGSTVLPVPVVPEDCS